MSRGKTKQKSRIVQKHKTGQSNKMTGFGNQNNKMPDEIKNLTLKETMHVQKAVQGIEKRMREEIKEQEQKIAVKFLVYMMVNVLSGEGFWEKSYKKRIPKMFDEMLKLSEAVRDGIVTWEEVDALTKEAGDNYNVDEDLIEKLVERNRKRGIG